MSHAKSDLPFSFAQSKFVRAGLPMAIAALVVFGHGGARAESNAVSVGNAVAHLDFKIIVPRVLFLQVGTGTALANNTTVDLITFTVPAANLGDGTIISGTGGDLTAGVVTAKVLGNNGNVTLTSATTGALLSGTDQISFAKISTTTATLTSATALPHPTLQDTGGGSVTVTANAQKIANQDARWRYRYLNDIPVAPGTYGGTVTNGYATYTASMP